MTSKICENCGHGKPYHSSGIGNCTKCPCKKFEEEKGCVQTIQNNLNKSFKGTFRSAMKNGYDLDTHYVIVDWVFFHKLLEECKKPKNHSQEVPNRKKGRSSVKANILPGNQSHPRQGDESKTGDKFYNSEKNVVNSTEGTFNLSEKIIIMRSYPYYGFSKEDIKTFVKKDKNINPKELAELFHDMYEEQAERVGWKTQEECRVEFKNLPKKNKEVMLLVVKAVISYLNKRTDKLAGEELSR